MSVIENYIRQSPSFNKADITMQQLIKAGREGMLYKAKMTHGAIKGHTMFTCKIYKKGKVLTLYNTSWVKVRPCGLLRFCSLCGLAARYKLVKREVLIMQNLNKHKNLLQLIDWDITEGTMQVFFPSSQLSNLQNPVHPNCNSGCIRTIKISFS